jgi:hypothetical protein
VRDMGSRFEGGIPPAHENELIDRLGHERQCRERTDRLMEPSRTRAFIYRSAGMTPMQ